MTAAGAGPATTALRDRWAAVMMANYGVPPLALTHGSGTQVWDADGREYVDLVAGIAVSTLGHAHPAVAAAVAEQATRLVHTSNLYVHEVGVSLAERLLGLLGAEGRVFFSQDGATANEAAYKLARRHGRTLDPDGGRLEIVAMHGGFHGRTMGALSVTGNPPKREPFAPLPGPVTFVPYGDADALRAAVGPQTAAVFVEPVQGEGGVVPPPAGYLEQVREICDESGALMVVDEVQSGIGRTGAWFASTDQGVVPDVLTLAKGLAGGLPLGACIGVGSAGDLFRPGDHGTTFGGNPLSCAAAHAVIDTVESEGLLEHVRTLGDRWAQELAAVDHPLLAGQRGVGLWRALVLSEPKAPAVEAAAREAGFLVNAVQPDAVRLAPPLVLSDADADAFVAALPGILAAAEGGA
ncbi:MAG: acetylornithine transaminase [Candidatus Nanopelagicales bacterium]